MAGFFLNLRGLFRVVRKSSTNITNMKNLLILSTLFISLFVGSAAQQPDLIDRAIFFDNPEYAGAQISPDGKYISFIKPLKDVRRSVPSQAISGAGTVNMSCSQRTMMVTKTSMYFPSIHQRHRPPGHKFRHRQTSRTQKMCGRSFMMCRNRIRILSTSA